MSTSNAEISEGRQALYYGGMALTVLGVLMFLSVMVSGFSSFNAMSGRNSSSPVWVSPGSEGALPPGFLEPGAGVTFTTPNGSPFGQSRGSNPMTALWGMILIVIGGGMMSVGSAGIRGSGIILDPQGAREDLKPWSQAAGGMLDDSLAASPIVTRAVENLGSGNAKETEIRVRCRDCRALNDEDAKFCDECGAKL